MTDRKTLNLRSPDETADAAPKIKKKGRGWEVSDARLDKLHARARELRRDSSDAHKALAKKFSDADMGRYSFKRHQVIGSAIVDFGCHNLGLAIAIDEDDTNAAIAKRRDKSLEAVGIQVMRIPASEILENMDDVLARLTVVMRQRIADKSEARRAHNAASRPGPARRSERPRGEGGARTGPSSRPRR